VSAPTYPLFSPYPQYASHHFCFSLDKERKMEIQPSSLLHSAHKSALRHFMQLVLRFG
jgi:hypothetical protein